MATIQPMNSFISVSPPAPEGADGGLTPAL
jgi:hypothetical protein